MGEGQDACSELSNSLIDTSSGLNSKLNNSMIKTVNSLDSKLNNWTDPKIDIDTAMKRLRRTNTKCSVTVKGEAKFITACFNNHFVTVEYKNGKYVRCIPVDDSEISNIRLY